MNNHVDNEIHKKTENTFWLIVIDRNTETINQIEISGRELTIPINKLLNKYGFTEDEVRYIFSKSKYEIKIITKYE